MTPDVDEIAKAIASSVSVTRRSPMNSPVLRMSQKSRATSTGFGSSSGLTRQRVVARYHSTTSTTRNVTCTVRLASRLRAAFASGAVHRAPSLRGGALMPVSAMVLRISSCSSP